MRRTLALAILAAGAIAPAAAAASGFPVAGADTTQLGATTPAVGDRFVALPAGNRTVVARIDRSSGQVVRHRTIAGRWVVAPVTQTIGTTGLSADGSTLVLARPRDTFPERSTRLAVLDGEALGILARPRLRGDFGLDAISPGGRWAYLIQYRNGNPADYAVRAYDLRRQRLRHVPIVDARNPGEKMTGFPISRSVSADGRWAYTLYGGGEEVFIHALDTARGRAFCVDLEGVADDQAFELTLATRGGHVDVLHDGTVLQRMDTRTLRAAPVPPTRPAAPAAATRPADPGDSFPWGLAAIVAVLAAAGLLAVRRYAPGTDSARRRSSSSSTETVP